MPPVHFSIFIVQRGRIIDPAIEGIGPGIGAAGISAIPGWPIIPRFIIITLAMFRLLFEQVREAARSIATAINGTLPPNLCAPPVKPVSDAVSNLAMNPPAVGSGQRVR
jgi:hypothetical protein